VDTLEKHLMEPNLKNIFWSNTIFDWTAFLLSSSKITQMFSFLWKCSIFILHTTM